MVKKINYVTVSFSCVGYCNSAMQITAGALVDLAKHKPEAVVDAGSICHLVRGLDNQDPKLKVHLQYVSFYIYAYLV